MVDKWTFQMKSDLIKWIAKTPAIYDKENPFHGDKVYVGIAWVGITKKLGLEGTGLKRIHIFYKIHAIVSIFIQINKLQKSRRNGKT